MDRAETRFDRTAAWLLAATLLFASAVLVVTLLILATPSDGWLIPGSGSTSTLSSFYGDWPTLLQSGDEVLAVNGLDVSWADNSWLAWHSLPAWRAGSTVTYSVRRAGQVLSLPVTLHQPDAASLLRALLATAADSPTEWSWPIIALVIFWLRPGNRAARLLLVAMVSHAAVVKLGWASSSVALEFAPPALFYARQFADDFWTWLFWPTVIWLVLSFPLPVWPLSRWPRAVPLLLYGLPTALMLASYVTLNIIPFTIGLVGELLVLVVALVLAAVNAYRHRDNAVARAQAGWILFGFAISQGLVLLLFLLSYTLPIMASLPGWLYWPFPMALPLCLGIAITRYRLWDIDLIIRRTLVYSLLTGLLAATYFGCVVVLQGALTALSGAARSELVTVLSTLAVAALFVPLRNRLQRFIDRRFYRRKYDAARTLAEFGAAVRDEVNLDELVHHLAQVVDETMQPQSVGLLILPAAAPPALPPAEAGLERP